MAETVLITGASSGIGEAAAYAFAERRCDLFLVARRTARLETIAQTCRRKGSARALFSSHDLSVAGEGMRVVDQCLSQLNALDVLICNAGYGVYGPVAEVPPETMARVWQVNYQSSYESIHRALPHFRGRGKGHIVLTSSIIGKKAMPYAAPYCATKFAQVALGESLWGELRGSGIGVSVICPGFTATEFQKASVLSESARSLRRNFSGQSPEKVARAMVRAVERGHREVHLTATGKMLMLVDRLSPALSTRIMAWLGNRERSQQDGAN